MTKTKKIQLKVSILPLYEQVLKKYLRKYLIEKHISENDTIPFVITCSAALEALLNDQIIVFSLSKYDNTDYKSIAEGLISIPFLKKLEYSIPLVTNNEFVFNKNNEVYLTLARLIKKRNALMHNKIFMEDFEAEEGPENYYHIGLDDQTLYGRFNIGTSVEECNKMFNSYLKLHKLFMAVPKIKRNKIVKPNNTKRVA